MLSIAPETKEEPVKNEVENTKNLKLSDTLLKAKKPHISRGSL